MKGLFTLLFVILIQTCLNSGDTAIIIPKENNLKEEGCTQDKKNYGFSFFATTSGFGQGSTFSFYCEDTNYNYFTCEVPQTEEGKEQKISCWAYTDTFPLLDTTNVVTLPKTLSYKEISIKGWENLRRELTFGFCSLLEPTSEFKPSEVISTTCTKDLNNEVTITGSFTGNLEGKKIFLTSTEDYTTYYFEPPLLVDNKIAKAICNIYAFSQNSGEGDQLKCIIDGKDYAQFFDIAQALQLVENSGDEVVRIRKGEPFKLKDCHNGSDDKSSFIKLSSLLLISLFLI